MLGVLGGGDVDDDAWSSAALNTSEICPGEMPGTWLRFPAPARGRGPPLSAPRGMPDTTRSLGTAALTLSPDIRSDEASSSGTEPWPCEDEAVEETMGAGSGPCQIDSASQSNRSSVGETCNDGQNSNNRLANGILVDLALAAVVFSRSITVNSKSRFSAGRREISVDSLCRSNGEAFGPRLDSEGGLRICGTVRGPDGRP